MLIRARVVLPVSQPAIENGAVALASGTIAGVGTWPELSRRYSGECVDLGDAILLPGLVNAHCHLDYTDMAGRIPAAQSFPDWIKSIVALKAQWSDAHYARSWSHGAKMLVEHGTTTVADIESVPELLPEIWTTTPLRVFSFLEIIGLRDSPAPAKVIREIDRKMLSLPAARAGLSPHAPYSMTASLLRLAGQKARARQWRLTTHVAESAAEFDMFMHRRGPLFDWLKEQRAMDDCGHGSPVRHLAELGLLGPRMLAVHVNYLWEKDAQQLADTGTHVVHCPRSHAYFRHKRFPRRELLRWGVNICLGTDSLASLRRGRRETPELDMRAEMRALAATSSDLTPVEILKMATVNGARALGLQGAVGELRAGAQADWIAIPFTGKASRAEEAVLESAGKVFASMIGGQWAIPPPD